MKLCSTVWGCYLCCWCKSSWPWHHTGW